MRSIFSILPHGVGLSLLVGLLSCSSSPTTESQPSLHPGAVLSVFNFSTTKINEIQKQKTDFTVHLQGKVGAQAPLMGGSKAYELKDSTGSIWVVTKDAIPAAGTEVRLNGKVRYQRILLDGKDQGAVYVEQEGAAEPIPANKPSSTS
jgi:uncharacterized protein YdeI (BOF family)